MPVLKLEVLVSDFSLVSHWELAKKCHMFFVTEQLKQLTRKFHFKNRNLHVAF